MPNYRIPSNSDNDANGMWKMNAVQRARKGGEWPDTYVPITPWADGYVSRYTGWANGDADPSGNFVNNWGAFGYSTWQFDAISIRCTTNDWNCQRVQMGNGYGGSGAGNLFWFVAGWTGTNVNPQSGQTMVLDSGFNTTYITSTASPTDSIMLGTWYGNTESTNLLYANQWYTVGICYTGVSQSQHGQSYSGNGYGTYVTSTSATMTGVGAGGTTITSSWEFAAITGGAGNYVFLTGPQSSTATAGPLGMFKVKVFN
tara:strand:- start:157 stop:927 length:771 start_codon:yes stop_codon:yes gene_type:complete